MTDIAIRHDQHNGTPVQQQWPTEPVRIGQIDPTGGRLVAWAQSMFAAKQLAEALCRTTFVPVAFRNKPDDAAAAIMYGDEVGMTPTMALQSVNVISGKPSLSAQAMVALVLSKGHDVWTEVDTPTKVVVCGRRKGSGHVERSEWTIERARKAGYTSNKKYDTDPQGMLFARGSGTICRKVAPDALAGMAYSTEELELEEASTVTVTAQRGEPTKRVAQRKAPAPVVEAPDLDDQPAAPEPAAPANPPSSKQNGMMHALFSNVGISDRTERLRFTSEVVGRTLTSSKELTFDDASLVIDALNKRVAEESTDAPVVEEPPGWEQDQ